RHRRRRAGRRPPLVPPPGRRPREGARAGAGPADAPRAGDRRAVAGRHPRRSRTQAAQRGPLRPPGDRVGRRRRIARRDRQALSGRPHAVGGPRATALALRADLLNAMGDPMAVPAYREALDGAEPGAARPRRVRLARAAVMAGDLETAAAAVDGLEINGGNDDAAILLTRGKIAFFTSDFAAADVAADEAQRLVLAGEPNCAVLDL